MKEIAAALIEASKAKDIPRQSRLLKQVFNTMYPIKRVNASSAKDMPYRMLDKIAFGVGDCWVWTGCVDAIGYGRFLYMGENKAHRVSYKYFVGDIPDGLFVLHKCDNRQCVNPEHLFLGTQKDNMIDMRNKGRGSSKGLSGTKNPMAKLNDDLVLQIRVMKDAGIKQIEISKLFGVSPMTISRVVRREMWK